LKPATPDAPARKNDSREVAAAKMRPVFQQEQWLKRPVSGPAVPPPWYKKNTAPWRSSA